MDLSRLNGAPRPAKDGWLAPVALCALLAGCVVGPNYHRPAAPAVSEYTRQALPNPTVSSPTLGGQAQRFVPGADVSGRWWTLFQSPRIDALVDRALKANPDLRSAQAALRGARETYLASRGALYPQVQAGFDTSRQKNSSTLASPLNSNAENFSLNTAQVQIAYAPDVFGGVRRQIESAAAQMEGQRYMLEAVYLTLTSNVVLAAVQEASLRGQVRSTQRSIEVGETLLSNLRLQRRLGQIAEGDVAAQEAALAQARLALPPLLKQLAQQQDLLAQLTGGVPSETPDDSVELESVKLPSDLPVSLPSRLVEQRPDIRAAEANLHAASALIGVAAANRLPSLSLTGSMGGASTALTDLFSSGNTFWSVGAGITQPIFDAGTLRHRQRAAEAAYDQAAAQYRSTVHGAFQNVADTLQALDQDARALKSAAEAQAATAKSLDLARQEQAAGETNAAAVLNARQADEAAISILVQARTSRLTDTVALYQALGGGWWNRVDDEAIAGK